MGERTVVDNQQVFDNRYLFSAVSPTTGTSFHLMSIEGFDSDASYVFLRELKKQHPHETIILIWDNAPCHRPQVLRTIPGLIVLFLPPYSPELNPTERFFEELRKATANQIFQTIEDQERVLETTLNELTSDHEAMKRLLGYEWILTQCEKVS